jgi:hypothetical protein
MGNIFNEDFRDFISALNDQGLNARLSIFT